ncbi:ubiquinol-cytochrome C chaperone family protein [Methyloceanibacter sp.]|uniref:ubiquinol-cytochrome C chaperone family protein n=1 Tax=Methyloceanibacter sp. TaxID=1965321 RepID=UPI002D54447F|nr:ubiquinol-cytochrome C chaperone family protein [Methyloceanibacter sp.]HZP08493.1 ubiquinol-cytochrome C chaperone family protein [Methyloceanibacter sp.]
MPFLPRAVMPWRRKEKASQKLYGAIVAQARLPVFYRGYGVPDTLEGRFVVLSLNLFVVLHRLKAEGGEALLQSQELADRFKDDMETVLRELGVSDLRVPKTMRALAASSAALLKAYERAFAGGEAQLASAIADALPLDKGAAEAAGLRLAHYVRQCIRSLEAEPYPAIKAGTLVFPRVSAPC